MVKFLMTQGVIGSNILEHRCQYRWLYGFNCLSVHNVLVLKKYGTWHSIISHSRYGHSGVGLQYNFINPL